jgi:hypothetical protein
MKLLSKGTKEINYSETSDRQDDDTCKNYYDPLSALWHSFLAYL